MGLPRHWENFLFYRIAYIFKETSYRRLWNALFHHRQTVLCFVRFEQRERRQPHSRKSWQHQIFSGKNNLLREYFTWFSAQFVFILYLLVTTIILINLLIAMMSDTYQRIQVSWAGDNKLEKKKIIFLSATIRHGMEIRKIKIDNVRTKKKFWC